MTLTRFETDRVTQKLTFFLRRAKKSPDAYASNPIRMSRKQRNRPPAELGFVVRPLAKITTRTTVQ